MDRLASTRFVLLLLAVIFSGLNPHQGLFQRESVTEESEIDR